MDRQILARGLYLTLYNHWRSHSVLQEPARSLSLPQIVQGQPRLSKRARHLDASEEAPSFDSHLQGPAPLLVLLATTAWYSLCRSVKFHKAEIQGRPRLPRMRDA